MTSRVSVGFVSGSQYWLPDEALFAYFLVVLIFYSSINVSEK